MDQQNLKSLYNPYPPSESELLFVSHAQEGNHFAAICIRTPPMNDFAHEPAILTSLDRMTFHVSGAGFLEHKFNGRYYREKATPGSICILPKGTQSAWRLSHSAIVLHFFFFPSLLASLTSQARNPAPAYLELRHLFNVHDPLIEEIGRAILSELQNGEASSQMYIHALTYALITHLARNYSTFTKAHLPPSGGLSPLQLRQVKSYIQDHMGESLSLNHLASSVGLSPSHFARRFKQSTSISPHQYLIRSRVQRAKALLYESQLTISEIARNVGFADQSHLTRHLQRAFGVSPKILKNSRNEIKEGHILQDQSP